MTTLRVIANEAKQSIIHNSITCHSEAKAKDSIHKIIKKRNTIESVDSRLPRKTFDFARNDDFLLDSSFSGLPRLLAKSRNDEVKNHKNTKSK